MPIVSSSGQCVFVWRFHTGCIYLFHIFHCDERSKETLFSCHTIPAHPVCGIHCIFSCMCAAGLFQRLLRPRWGCATKTAGDDGEQQLRVSNSRLRQNNWCVHCPYLYVYICPLLTIIYCTHLVVFFSSSTNVLGVSGDAVPQTLFGLQIAGVQPGEIWAMEALL